MVSICGAFTLYQSCFPCGGSGGEKDAKHVKTLSNTIRFERDSHSNFIHRVQLDPDTVNWDEFAMQFLFQLKTASITPVSTMFSSTAYACDETIHIPIESLENITVTCTRKYHDEIEVDSSLNELFHVQFITTRGVQDTSLLTLFPGPNRQLVEAFHLIPKHPPVENGLYQFSVEIKIANPNGTSKVEHHAFKPTYLKR